MQKTWNRIASYIISCSDAFPNNSTFFFRNRSVCSVSWSNVLDPESFDEHQIKILDFVNDFVITSITYLLPGIWMCYMYFWMHKALNLSIVGEINNINLQALHERKQVSQSCLHFQLFIYLCLCLLSADQNADCNICSLYCDMVTIPPLFYDLPIFSY